MSTQENKEVLRRYFASSQAFDPEGMRACFTERAIKHFPIPGDYDYADNHGPAVLIGRDAIAAAFRANVPRFYRPGSFVIEIQHMVAEGDFVAVQWVHRAKTLKRNEDYKNHCHFLFRFEDNLIAEYWEYCDTAYGRQMLS